MSCTASYTMSSNSSVLASEKSSAGRLIHSRAMYSPTSTGSMPVSSAMDCNNSSNSSTVSGCWNKCSCSAVSAASEESNPPLRSRLLPFLRCFGIERIASPIMLRKAEVCSFFLRVISSNTRCSRSLVRRSVRAALRAANRSAPSLARSSGVRMSSPRRARAC